jgi:hypothetical protein
MTFAKIPRQYRVPAGIRCAGTVDFIGILHKLNGIYVLDFKTAKDDYPEYRLQTAKYRTMYSNDDVNLVDGNGIVILDKETGYPRFYDHSDTFESDLEAFNHLLDFWWNRYSDKLKNGHAPSVTEVLKICDKSGPLMWWAVNCMRERAFELYERKPDWDFHAIIEDARKNFRRVSQKALDVGTEVHKSIEIFLKTGKEPKIDNDQVLAGFLAFLEFNEEYGLEPIEIERVLYG